MTLRKRFEEVVSELKSRGCRFAVAGGLAATLYRSEIRATNDADLLILAPAGSDEVAREILESMGFGVAAAKLHDLRRLPRMNKKSEPPVILVGRESQDSDAPGVDFILPDMPWFTNALENAEKQLVDFGFGPIPTLTVEDLIIAKVSAARPKDIDDLLSIFGHKNEIDLAYLTGEFSRLGLKLPRDVRAHAPKALRVASRGAK